MLQWMARRAMTALAISAVIMAGLSSVQPVGARDFREPDDNKLETHGHYANRDGQQVHRPSRTKTGEVSEGATAQCRDQSYSLRASRSGG